jgi:hypothetical protein
MLFGSISAVARCFSFVGPWSPPMPGEAATVLSIRTFAEMMQGPSIGRSEAFRCWLRPYPDL